MVPCISGPCRLLGLGNPGTAHPSQTFGILTEDVVISIPNWMSYSLRWHDRSQGCKIMEMFPGGDHPRGIWNHGGASLNMGPSSPTHRTFKIKLLSHHLSVGPKLHRVSYRFRLPNGCYFYIRYSPIHLVLAYLSAFQAHKPWRGPEVRKRWTLERHSGYVTIFPF